MAIKTYPTGLQLWAAGEEGQNSIDRMKVDRGALEELSGSGRAARRPRSQDAHCSSTLHRRGPESESAFKVSRTKSYPPGAARPTNTAAVWTNLKKNPHENSIRHSDVTDMMADNGHIRGGRKRRGRKTDGGDSRGQA